MSNELLVLPSMSPETVRGLSAPPLPTGDVIAREMLAVANAGTLALKFASEIKEVTTPEQYADVLDAYKSCQTSKKKMGECRSGFTDPFEAWKKRNIAVEKCFNDIFDQGAEHFKKLAVDWDAKKKAEAEAERQRIQRELAEKAAIAEAERKAKEAAEQLKRSEEDAWLEYAMVEAEAKAEEEGAGTAEHMKADAELKAQQAEIERQRAEREAEKQKAEADAEALRQEELRKASAAMSTLKLTATKGVKKTWDFTIVNADKVVRQFLMPDEKKIRAANKAGLLVDGEGKPTEMAAGLNIFEVSGLNGRGAGAR